MGAGGWIVIGIMIVVVFSVAVKAAGDEIKATDEQLDAKPGDSVRAFGLNYLGGHPNSPAPAKAVTLAVTSDYVALVKSSRILLKVPMNAVIGMQVESEGEAKQRYTATRMVAFGVFALAAPKRTAGSAIIAVDTTDGPILLEKERTLKPQALKLVAQPMAKVRQFASGQELATPNPQLEPSSPRSGVADELAKLADLHGSGLLTDSEFTAAKRELLGGDEGSSKPS